MAEEQYPVRLELLRFVLRPLVRCALKGQHTFQHVVDVLKMVFVEIAVEEMGRSTQKINTSRISVMTGMHRKDVKRIFRQGEPPVRRTAPLLVRVIGQWEQDSRYTTKSGKPRILSWEGESSEFAELVRGVSDDVRAGTVLFELERSGVVEKTPRGLKLIRPTYPVHQDSRGRWEFLSKNVETLILAAEQNMFNPPETFNLHIRTEYDNISKQHLPIIRRWLYRSGKAYHKKIRSFLSKYDHDVTPRAARGRQAGAPQEGGGRVVVGAFSLTEEESNQ